MKHPAVQAIFIVCLTVLLVGLGFLLREDEARQKGETAAFLAKGLCRGAWGTWQPCPKSAPPETP